MSNVKAPAPAAAEAAPAKKKPLLLLLVVGIVLLGGLGAGGWFLAPRFLGKPAPAEAKPKVEEVKATVSLGGVVVNLAGETRRYLRVAISLGVTDAKEVKEVEESKPQLLDLFISALSSAEADALTSEDERTELKKTLLERIHGELKLHKVARIYFTEFVIQ